MTNTEGFFFFFFNFFLLLYFVSLEEITQEAYILNKIQSKDVGQCDIA